jgi:hypothetical protein
MPPSTAEQLAQLRAAVTAQNIILQALLQNAWPDPDDLRAQRDRVCGRLEEIAHEREATHQMLRVFSVLEEAEHIFECSLLPPAEPRPIEPED